MVLVEEVVVLVEKVVVLVRVRVLEVERGGCVYNRVLDCVIVVLYGTVLYCTVLCCTVGAVITVTVTVK